MGKIRLSKVLKPQKSGEKCIHTVTREIPMKHQKTVTQQFGNGAVYPYRQNVQKKAKG